MTRQAYTPSPQLLGSSTWIELRDHLKQRLDDLRKQNDKLDASDAETAITRGRIAEVKRLLELEKPKPEIHTDATE